MAKQGWLFWDGAWAHITPDGAWHSENTPLLLKLAELCPVKLHADGRPSGLETWEDAYWRAIRLGADIVVRPTDEVLD